MERRAFLRRNLAAAGWGLLARAGFGTGALSLSGCGEARPAAPGSSALQVLSGSQARTLRAVAQRVVAPLDAARLQVVERIDGLLAAADELTQRDVGQLLTLFESPIAGLLFDLRPQAFTALDPVGQDAALAAWRDSRLAVRRSGFQALQRLCLAVTYTNPQVYAGIHYPGPPLLVRADGSTVGGPRAAGTSVQ